MLIWTVAIVVGPLPIEFDGVTEYAVVAAGAEMLTEQAVDEMPLPQAHEVTALPAEQLALNVTEVPAATGDEEVLGDWAMLQLLGAEPGPALPIYTVVLNVAPGPEAFDGVTVYDVVVPGATVRAEPRTPMFQL